MIQVIQSNMHRITLAQVNGKLVHKPMLQKNEEVAQGLAVGSQALDQLQRCKSCFSGLKESRVGGFIHKIVSCRTCFARAD